ncbi:bucentaur or craniofacial development-domain-containing protein, partial [Cokeromyces recurvatus]|uniref:bucentaur or craniofacial development-domain-containing protein n=1 Tax=Cokeromyces recurvatus TaxID=90255 RepID=UPI0022212AF7
MSILKDFYTNFKETEQDSEEDSDFVPNENDSDDQELTDDDEEEEEREKETATAITSNKRGLSPELKQDVQLNKKSRIDAIWADMNNDKSSPKLENRNTNQVNNTDTLKIQSKSKKPQRPQSQLSSLISKYNIKEPKINTLEKSKLDWQRYVEREGIRDELTYKNKDGYMEKVAFLQRVDDRRLNQLKEGQKKT